MSQKTNASSIMLCVIYRLRCLTESRVSSPIKTSRLIRGLSPHSWGVSFSSYSSWTPCSMTWWALPAKATMPWKHTHTHITSDTLTHTLNEAFGSDYNNKKATFTDHRHHRGGASAPPYLWTDDGHGLSVFVLKRLFPQQILKHG